MKVWYDACTGKHVRYGVAVAKRLRSRGHSVLLTTRQHPDTLPMIKFLNEKFTVVGKYDPETLLTRLKEGTRRQLAFCRLFEKSRPDLAVSHGSIDLCRVAFGLAVPAITTVDTPYAEAVHKLTLPLSKYIVASRAIPEENLKPYVAEGKIQTFEGVDEVAWIKNFKPPITYDFGRPLIVVRQLEEKAAYSTGRVDMLALAKKLTRLGKVVFLARYSRDSIEGLITPKFVDSASLVAQADLFVGVGGTITREAALQGTPSIVVNLFQGQFVNDFLVEKGFPIFKTEPSKVAELAKKVLAQKCDVKDKLEALEDPVDLISAIAEKTRGH